MHKVYSKYCTKNDLQFGRFKVKLCLCVEAGLVFCAHHIPMPYRDILRMGSAQMECCLIFSSCVIGLQLRHKRGSVSGNILCSILKRKINTPSRVIYTLKLNYLVISFEKSNFNLIYWKRDY